MAINYKILVDASGSMGFMNGTKEKNKYLLPDGNTRTDLVKKILVSNILPNLKYVSNVTISTFRGEIQLDSDGKQKIKNNKLYTTPRLDQIYEGTYNQDIILSKLEGLKNPIPAGTPLYFALCNTITKSKESHLNIIVISDGDANDRVSFDTEIVKLLDKEKKTCVIHIIGISQVESARIKSKNLALKTNGVYVNLKAMDYDNSELNLLLSKLNSNIVTKALQTNISDNKSIVGKSKTETKVKNDYNSDSLIEKQVQKNTQSLEFISSQLTNIINILQPQENLIEDVGISENTIYNNKIGRMAEKFMFNELNNMFKANENIQVLWLNESEEQGFPYDFLVKDDNKELYYECKGSSSDLNEFQLTRNEWNFYLDNRKNYRLCFVSNVESSPSYIRFMDLLEDMNKKTIIPCSSKNKKYKANRIVFQVC